MQAAHCLTLLVRLFAKLRRGAAFHTAQGSKHLVEPDLQSDRLLWLPPWYRRWHAGGSL